MRNSLTLALSILLLGGCVNHANAANNANRFVATADTISELKTINPYELHAKDGLVRVKGYHSVGDGGGGVFRADFTTGATANGGTVIDVTNSNADSDDRWERVYQGALKGRWFGTAGDGSTDDSSEIQAAIDEATSNDVPLELDSNDTYLLSSEVSLSGSVKLQGRGATIKKGHSGEGIKLVAPTDLTGGTATNATTSTVEIMGASFTSNEHADKWAHIKEGGTEQRYRIQSNDTDTLTFYETLDTAPSDGVDVDIYDPIDNVEISNLSVNGQSQGNTGILIHYADRVRIDNVDTYDNSGNGLTIHQARNVRVSNSKFQNNQFGAFVYNSEGVTVANCWSESNNGSYGIQLKDVRNGAIMGCNSLNDSTHGFNIKGSGRHPARNLEIDNSRAENAGGRGIWMHALANEGTTHDAENFTITGCQSYNCATGFSSLDTADVKLRSAVIAGSVAFSNQSGLGIDSEGTTVIGCTFESSNSRGATVSGDQTAIIGCRFENNNLTDGNDADIRIDSNATDILVRDCTFARDDANSDTKRAVQELAGVTGNLYLDNELIDPSNNFFQDFLLQSGSLAIQRDDYRDFSATVNANLSLESDGSIDSPLVQQSALNTTDFSSWADNIESRLESLDLIANNGSSFSINIANDEIANSTFEVTAGTGLTGGGSASLGSAVTVNLDTPVSLGNGGTGASLVDPNADRIMFWDDSGGAVEWLTPGNNLTITGNQLDASGSTDTTADAKEDDTIIVTNPTAYDFSGTDFDVVGQTGGEAGVSLASNSVSFGGVSVNLGGSDPTPAFDLQDASNFGDAVDILVDTEANKPSAGTADRIFIDTTNNEIERDTGAAWQVIGQIDTTDDTVQDTELSGGNATTDDLTEGATNKYDDDNVVNDVDNTEIGEDISLANGGTGASLVDPGADRILFWDDSGGAVEWLTPGSNLTITGNTLDASTGSSGIKQELSWGATFVDGTAGDHASANGLSDSTVVGNPTVDTMYPVTQAGTLTDVAILTSNDLSGQTTDFEIYKNGVGTGTTVSATSGSNGVDNATVSISVSAGDTLGFEYTTDGGTDPSDTLISATIE